MSQFPYMPWYASDYERDTKHLTIEQDCIYRRLIDAMWAYGGRLPNDEGRIAGIIRITLKKWRFVSPAVLPFFEVEGDTITHKRITAELKKAEDIADKKRAAGKKGGRPKKREGDTKKSNGSAPHRGDIEPISSPYRGDIEPKFSSKPAETKETAKAELFIARAVPEPEPNSGPPSSADPNGDDVRRVAPVAIGLDSSSGDQPETVVTTSDGSPSPSREGGLSTRPLVEKVATANGSAVSIAALVDSILGRGPPVLSAEKAVLADAERRLTKDVVATGRQIAGELFDMFGTDPPTYAVAIEAEANAPGGGLKIALTMLDQHRENLGPIIAGCAPAWRIRLNLDAATLRAAPTPRTLQ